MSHSITVPPALQKGALIGIVCPAGYMPAERAATCIETLKEWGYRVRIGETLGGNSTTYFSGTDEERLSDLQRMMDDPEVDAILCGRGGYGVGRIIDRLSFRAFRKKPKWIIGFSDITVLHAHLNSRYRIASLHAPMAAAFNDGGASNEYVGSLRDALLGKKGDFSCMPHRYNRPGFAEGPLVGGNLALLAHLVGTPSDLKTDGRILFLEDVGEYLYNIDRMLHQYKRSGKLKRVAGIIIGGFTDNKDTERPFGQEVYSLIHSIVDNPAIPICYDFPVSHEKENVALKVGVSYRLEVTEKQVSLREV